MKAAHVGHKDGCLVFYNVTSYRNIQLSALWRNATFFLLTVYKFRCLSLREKSVTW